MLGKSISKNSLLLGIFAVTTAGVLAFTQLMTSDRIAKAERAAQQKALLEILASEAHDNDLLNDTIPVPQQAANLLGITDNQHKIFLARNQDKVTAIIVPVIAPDGYSGDIEMIVGVKSNGDILGVRVLKHKETPGLGDKIDLKKSQWILSFNGKNLTQPALDKWKVKKDGGDFDQFAGATITPRAVVKKVKQVLEIVQQNSDELFDKTNGENHE
jgi:Na+-translocating ferredoxin:NAD+ oxidoreductase subunit G